MKLFYSPGACSLAPHIVMRELGAPFELAKVDFATKRAGGEDYLKINPKGYVPTLRLDNGETLTEVAVVLQYIADQKPEAGLAAAAGTFERYRLMEWLAFISTEVHKALGALFNPKLAPEWRAAQIALFGRRADLLCARLKAQPFLMGARFSIADAYLFTILNWTGMHKVDMSKWPELKDYMERIRTRPAVTEAMRAEGLIS